MEAAAFAREWRNRRLAHRDLRLALASEADPLPGASRADVEKALGAFRTLMNRIDEFYNSSTVGYEYSEAGAGDADDLVAYLSEGLASERAKRERVLSGSFSPEDLIFGEDV
jgi:hypothetical protein